jgi:hypothetical protein
MRSMIKHFVVVIALIFFSMSCVRAVQPSGATIVPGTPQTAPMDSAGSIPAQAGNVTELTIYGKSTTQTWQGYFGNITGTIQLADASDHVMYNWTQINPLGEVYASTNQTIYWTNVQCLNYTATGTHVDESGNGGTTNKFGTNLTNLESSFGVNASDVDGVDETFSLSGPGTHNLFYTANQKFDTNQCTGTRIFDNSGAGVSGHFEEVLLYEPKSSSVIFTSLLNQDLMGFDSRSHDFEMLVLENGHESDVATTPYYFYVEIQ